jgi:succinyl-diaminopimelate desuccinylase
VDDDRFLVDTLTEFLRTPAEAPLGQNFIDPRDPHVALFVRRVIEPRVEALGLKDLLHDDDNNLVFTVGDGAGATLLLMGYSSSHHGNRMEDPYSGRIEDASRYGVNELCAFGRGAGKKGSLAAALAALKIVVESGAKLRGRLVFAVNTEGYSSHRGSQRIFDGLDRLGFKPDTALLCVGTGLRACLGNRGRVDVLVTVRGRETHSSQPAAGLNAIDGAYDVLTRLRMMRYEKSDPRLGREQITPYKLVIGPVAPHTIPEIAEFRLDRRLLPGSRVDNAVAEIRALLADLGQFGVEVAEGPFMLPSVTSPDAPLIQSLGRASQACRGTALETFYAGYTGDAGYAASVGVPPVEFGPSASNETEKPTGTEFVPISQVKTAAQIYAYVIKDMLR